MSVLVKVLSWGARRALLQAQKVCLARNSGYKVAILGANGKTGKPLSLMLKQCSNITEISLYDKESTNGLAAELEQLDTTSVVKPNSELKPTIDGADIIVLMAGTRGDNFEHNAPIVSELSKEVAKLCPKALLTLVTSPINSMLPLVVEIYRKINKSVDYNKIFGFTTTNSIRASCFAAEVLSIPPEKLSVSVVGGTGAETMVPVLNTLPLGTEEAVRVTAATREAALKEHPLSEAYAISRFVVALTRALSGSRDIVECAYVHSSTDNPPYLATPLQLGSSGIEKNLGIPSLSQYEQGLLETALPTIRKDIDKGLSFAKTL